MSYLRPLSVQDYLPEDHLARFVVEIVDQLDLRHLSAVYAGLEIITNKFNALKFSCRILKYHTLVIPHVIPIHARHAEGLSN